MIYCVEDDDSIRQLEIYALQSAGFEAKGFSKGDEFWEQVKVETPHLIILDIMLPDEDGIAILKKLRQHKTLSDIPVILASAKGSEYDKVLGLDSGADDYIAKPFGMMELVARAKALLRRSKVQRDDEIKIANITMNLVSHRVYVRQEEVNLSKKEFAVLEMLMLKPDKVISRETLLSEIWGYDFCGETRTVDVHIRTLRAKLGDAGDNIETVRGMGYRISK